jgi:DNA modification methylase
MIACENLGRKCRGIEIDPGYVAVCLERFKTTFSGKEIKLIKEG